MIRTRSPRRLVTTLALAAPLLLASSAGSDSAAGVCTADATSEAQEAAAAARDRAEERAAEQGIHAGEHVVVLNGRGYNYGPRPHAPGEPAPAEVDGTSRPASRR